MSGLPEILPLTFVKGSTFSLPIRWEREPLVYRQVTGISKTGPARITVPGHNIPDAWRAAVTSVQGMREINAQNWPPKDSDFNRVTVIDANTVDMNAVNAAEYSPYKSGGYLVYYTPVDLAGCTARLTVKNRPGGIVLLALTSAGGHIVLNNTDKVITITVSASALAALTWTRGVYDLEVEDGSGVVTKLYAGTAILKDEVTT